MPMEKNRRLRMILYALILLMAGGLVTRLMDLRQMQRLLGDRRNWAKLELVLSQIDRHYVDTVDHAALTEDLLPLIMRELDPHSVYLPPVDLQVAEDELQGNFDGIGIMFHVPQDTAIVSSVIGGGPSERAGLLPGDRIVRVGERVIAGVGMNQDSMVRLMKGPSGSQVRIEVLREGERVPFEITRAKIPVKSLDVAYMINDTTGYMKLAKFTRTSHSEFMAALDPLLESGMTRLLFDLRDNTGGYFDQALLLANEFLNAGDLIVYMEGRARNRQEFRADGRGHCRNLELAVLINENSASSSEIFAGAVQDNDRGVLYGRRSFGKGLVQEPVYFTDGSGIRLTVARYYTPAGRCIQKPYAGEGDAYGYDLLERYRHGEMMDADSIPRNDSLLYHTRSGRRVYGGGGIIPDVFVPIDTAGVTDLLVRINRQSLQSRFSLSFADRHRKELQQVDSLPELERLLDSYGLEQRFLSYMKDQGVRFNPVQWRISGPVVLTQIRAMVGQYSKLGDLGFYAVIAPIDPVIREALRPVPAGILSAEGAY